MSGNLVAIGMDQQILILLQVGVHMQMNFRKNSRLAVTNLMAVTLFLVLTYCMTLSWRMVDGDLVVADSHRGTGL